MVLIVIVLALVILAGVRVRFRGCDADYISKDCCNSIKGVFIIIVFISHFQQYVAQAGGHTCPLLLGQLMVTMFLFYSGFGVMEQIRARGEDYVRSMPRRRILATLLNFDVAVLAFIIVDLIVGNSIGLRQCLLSFVCWDSVGNSNWYIFAIILCYAIAYAVGLNGRTRKYEHWFVSAVCVLTMWILLQFKPGYWSNTLLCFPLGMIYSYFRKQIERTVQSNWIISVVVLMVLFVATYRMFILHACVFALLVVVLSMKISIQWQWLTWCGANLFPLYIYQRIPMIILFAVVPNALVGFWVVPCFILSACVTFLIAYHYRLWRISL